MYSAVCDKCFNVNDYLAMSNGSPARVVFLETYF